MKKKTQQRRSLRGLVQRVGWAVQIIRQDGSTFFAAPARGIVTPVWNMGNKPYADGFVRELRENGFNAKRVRVVFADPVALNEKALRSVPTADVERKQDSGI